MSLWRKGYLRARRKIAYLSGADSGVTKWNNIMRSESVLPQLRLHFNESAHPMVHIEITSHCNYKCSFCPQSSHERPKEFMSRSDFLHIIKELKKIDYSSSVVLNVNNEPLLHPNILEFCKEVVKELPSADLGFNTNGSLLTKQQFDALVALERPPLVVVNDYRRDHAVADRVEEWITQAGLTDHRFVIYRRSPDEKLSNSAGNQQGCDSKIEDFQSIICTWPFQAMFVGYDLKVFLCCLDFNHDVILGDLRSQGLMDIWQDAKFHEIREKMLITQRMGLPLCGKCDAEYFNLPKHIAD